MEMSLGARLKHAWNVFTAKETVGGRWDIGPSNYYRPDRPIFSRGNERSIITSVYNRIALDVAAITIQHVRLDDEGRFTSVMDSSLNDCLSLEANIDQTGRAFIQDVVQSMLDEGCVAIVPVDTDLDPKSGSYKIETMRTGKILEWYPQHVKVRVYNERTGRKEDILVPKRTVAIVENPFYGDLTRNTRQLQSSDTLNDDINVANEISIVADPFARENFHRMRYVVFMGAKWKISKVEVGYPRLILTIGGLYHESEN